MLHIQRISRNQLQVTSLEGTTVADNPKALKQSFKLYVSFLKDADLISGQTIAIDGTKSRADNSSQLFQQALFWNIILEKTNI